jgi:hypothetical protein
VILLIVPGGFNEAFGKMNAPAYVEPTRRDRDYDVDTAAEVGSGGCPLAGSNLARGVCSG